jgi:hypothetical protein
MDEKQFDILIERLDTITKLLAANLPQEMTLSEKAMLLHNVGLRSTEIAKILGTSSKYVSVALFRGKKSKGKRNSEDRNVE